MISVEHLTKSFGEFKAVDDVSFTVNEGETFALLGPNGSGKSTTLKCIAGLSIPTAGSVRIAGVDALSDPRKGRALFSYLPQKVTFHDSLTAAEVLKFYGDLRKLPASRIQETLTDPHFSFNGFAGKYVRELSGGMVQRLGLAVACLPDAPILLLDEPTVGLDPEGAVAFRRFLKGLKERGKTIVFTSHVLSDVEELADRVAILVGGRFVALESAALLREELAETSQMVIVLEEPPNGLAEIVMRAGAARVDTVGNELLISAAGPRRLAILEALMSSNAKIHSFRTRDANLEDVYLRYAKRQDDGGGSPSHSGPAKE